MVFTPPDSVEFASWHWQHASFDDLTKRFGKRQLFRWALPYEYLLLEYLVGAPTVNAAAPTLQIRYHCAYA